jgi:hypothetical protein
MTKRRGTEKASASGQVKQSARPDRAERLREQLRKNLVKRRRQRAARVNPDPNASGG